MSKTSEDIINSLFGDNETITKEQATAALKTAGIKLADLSEGDFVAVGKYNDRISKLESERDAQMAKVKEYETKITTTERTKVLGTLGVSEDFTEFVLDQVGKTLDENNTDFEASAKKYIEAHKQYVKDNDEDNHKGNGGQSNVPSGLMLGGGAPQAKKDDPFDELNQYLKTGEI